MKSLYKIKKQFYIYYLSPELRTPARVYKCFLSLFIPHHITPIVVLCLGKSFRIHRQGLVQCVAAKALSEEGETRDGLCPEYR